jgi:hypothetical protein
MVRYGLMDVGNVYVIKVNNYAHLYHVQLLNVHNQFFYQIDVVLPVQVRFVSFLGIYLKFVFKETSLVPEPIPSSQVCYASQYVTGEELEFDKCTKCICLHNIAFCSASLCPPLRCSSPIYDSTLCCPICPPKSESSPTTDLLNIDEDVCKLDDGMIKHAGELWKHDDCRSCLCSSGQIECFSQTCDQRLPCSNPVLKKGQCCPFCLPPTAAIAVCIFNYIQYRSGEHWNVS